MKVLEFVDTPQDCKERATVDCLLNIKSYLEIASNYIENIHDNEELFHCGLLIDKMQESLDKMKKYYEILR